MNDIEIKYSNEEIARVAEESNIDEQAFAIYCWNLHITSDYEDEVSAFEDSYIGELSVQDYAEELADDIYPDAVRSGYFDYESFARDLELGGEVWFHEGYLFRNY
jgi:antirestriction protein